MLTYEKLVLGTIPVSNLATGGTIGTAAATVDKTSSISLNQTTTGQTVTIPSPGTSDVGQPLRVMNIGTASFTLLGIQVLPSTFADLVWNGTAWVLQSLPVLETQYYVSQALVAGANVITHNFGLTTNTKALMFSVWNDATGQFIDGTLSAFTANTVTFTVNTAVTLANIMIVSRAN